VCRFDYCENLYQKDLTKTLRINVDKALINFQSGIDAAIVSISLLVIYDRVELQEFNAQSSLHNLLWIPQRRGVSGVYKICQLV
jgi:hypothetical protein